jgi:hypothetical protein
MPANKSFEAYGRYLVTRDRLNAVLEAAIIQETQLRVFHGVLLVSPLTTKVRLGVLKAVLQQAGGEKQDIVPLVSELMQDLKRQAIGQGTATVSGDALSFTRAEVGPRTAGSVVTYSAAEIDEATETLGEHIDALAAALAIDADALVRIQRSVSDALAKRGKDNGDEE